MGSLHQQRNGQSWACCSGTGVKRMRLDFNEAVESCRLMKSVPCYGTARVLSLEVSQGTLNPGCIDSLFFMKAEVYLKVASGA